MEGGKKWGADGSGQGPWGHSEVTLQQLGSPSLLRKFAEVGFISGEVRPCSVRLVMAPGHQVPSGNFPGPCRCLPLQGCGTLTRCSFDPDPPALLLD